VSYLASENPRTLLPLTLFLSLQLQAEGPARSGNFAVAGKSLNTSQSGVSRAIARLEARFGARLLEEQIVPLLAGLEESAASVATSKDAVRGTLRVNMDPFIAQLMLGPH
jgi:DNA-binding transcriptional LysR family regulator